MPSETKESPPDLSLLVDIGNGQWLKASLITSVKVRKGNDRLPYVVSIEQNDYRRNVGVTFQTEDEAIDHASELIERINGALQVA